MNKAEFLQKLERSLRGLPKSEKELILSDFEEHFRNSIDEGKSEEATVEMLGNPASVGRMSRTELLVEKAEINRTTKSVFRAVIAAAGLGLFNVIIVIGPFFGIVGVLIGLWAAAAGIGLSGLASIAAVGFSPVFRSFFDVSTSYVLFTVFAGIGLAAFGGLSGIGMVYVTKWFARLTLAYVKATVRVVKGS